MLAIEQARHCLLEAAERQKRPAGAYSADGKGEVPGLSTGVGIFNLYSATFLLSGTNIEEMIAHSASS